MQASIRNLTLTVLAPIVFGAVLYAQYPGPADTSWRALPSGFDHPADHPPRLRPSQQYARDSLEYVIPSSETREPARGGLVSAAELKHPLSRKGSAMLVKAQQKLSAGKDSEAIDELKKALKEKTAAAYAHGLLGAIYLHADRIQEAVSELQAAVQVLPVAANYSNLGYALCLSGDVEQGSKALWTALQMAGSPPQAHLLAGILLLNFKARNEEACDHIRRAGTVRFATLALAVCYARESDSADADQQVRQFASPGDESTIAFWKSWVDQVAELDQPSRAFGIRPQ